MISGPFVPANTGGATPPLPANCSCASHTSIRSLHLRGRRRFHEERSSSLKSHRRDSSSPALRFTCSAGHARLPRLPRGDGVSQRLLVASGWHRPGCPTATSPLHRLITSADIFRSSRTSTRGSRGERDAWFQISEPSSRWAAAAPRRRTLSPPPAPARFLQRGRETWRCRCSPPSARRSDPKSRHVCRFGSLEHALTVATSFWVPQLIPQADGCPCRARACQNAISASGPKDSSWGTGRLRLHGIANLSPSSG